MKLINTEGLAFIGPGSEWFWSAVSGVVLAVTFIAIYRQLRIARSANAFEEMRRILDDWQSERATRHLLDLLLAIRAGAEPENVPRGAAAFVADFWEGVAALVRAGHVERKLIYEYFSLSCQWSWATVGPIIGRMRNEAAEPNISQHFEWLAGEMATMDRKAGVAHAYDAAYLASMLESRIENLQARMRVAEELRAVVVRPSDRATFTKTSAATRRRRPSAR